MDSRQVIEGLKGRAGFFEVYEERTFRAYRNAKNGGVQTVQVTVLDAGPDADTERYMVVATSDDGKTASGNSNNYLDVALMGVHWQDLDR